MERTSKDYINEAIIDNKAERLKINKSKISPEKNINIDSDIVSKINDKADKIKLNNKFLTRNDYFDRRVLDTRDNDGSLANEVSKKGLSHNKIVKLRLGYGAISGGFRTYRQLKKEKSIKLKNSNADNLKDINKIIKFNGIDVTKIGINSVRGGVKSVAHSIKTTVTNFESQNEDVGTVAVQKTRDTIRSTRRIYKNAKRLKKGGKIAFRAVNYIKRVVAKQVLVGVKIIIAKFGLIILLIFLLIFVVVLLITPIISIVSFSWISGPEDLSKAHLHITEKVGNFKVDSIKEGNKWLNEFEENTTFQLKYNVYYNGVYAGDNPLIVKLPNTEDLISYLSITDESWLFITVEWNINDLIHDMYKSNSEIIEEIEYETVKKYDSYFVNEYCEDWKNYNYNSKPQCISYMNSETKQIEIAIKTKIINIEYQSWEYYLNNNIDTLFEKSTDYQAYKEMVQYGSLLGEFIGSPFDNWSKNISSEWGYRINPVAEDEIIEVVYHSGVDIAANAGTIIHAGVNGIVEIPPFNPNGLGNAVYIYTNDGKYLLRYGHCKDILVSNGDIVKKGDPIATVGSTGLSTGNHLHLTLRKTDNNEDLNAAFFMSKK